MLLRAGASPNIFTIEREPVLQRAVLDGDYGLMQLLLKSGVDVNVKDEEGKTALHRSADEASEYLTGVLLEAGADVNIQDNEGWTPLFHALAACEFDIVDMLLEHSDLTLITNTGHTVLHIAMQYCPHPYRHEAMEKLIGKGIDLNACNVQMHTALSLSWNLFDLEAMEMLVKAGCDVNAQGSDGQNLLYTIAATDVEGEVDREEILTKMGRLLIEAGIDVDGGTDEELNPLTYCIRRPKSALFKELLLANCDTKMFRKETKRCCSSKCVHRDRDLRNFLLFAHIDKCVYFATYLFVDCFCGHRDVQQMFFAFFTKYETFRKSEGLDLDRPPLSLTRLCRVALRSSLPRGCSFQSAVDQLPLPSLLKDFVGLRDSPL